MAYRILANRANAVLIFLAGILVISLPPLAIATKMVTTDAGITIVLFPSVLLGAVLLFAGSACACRRDPAGR